MDLYIKVRKFIVINYNEISENLDQDNFIHGLPCSLKDSVLKHSYGISINSMRVFKELDDDKAIWTILQKSMTIKTAMGDAVYMENDPAT